MAESFIELEKQYQKLSHELRHTLEKLAWHCSGFEIEEVDYVINPYSVNHGEEYFDHHIVDDKNKVYVTLQYEDSCDDYDTSSHVKFPLHWVEHAYNDTLEEIDAEIKSEILKFHYNEVNSSKRTAIFQAKEFGLITEEQAKVELEKLYEK